LKTIMPDVGVTSVPAYGRRPVLVTGVPVPRPTTVAGVFRAAARLLAANGLHHGDYVADPFDRLTRTPHRARPMSLVAAIRCATTGDPHRTAPLSERAVSVLASRLEVGGLHAPDDPVLREIHVDDWADVDDRRVEGVCAVLYAAADAVEVSS
jgi:hypothetical protein